MHTGKELEVHWVAKVMHHKSGVKLNRKTEQSQNETLLRVCMCIYIYIYICVCVCVCVCMYIILQVDTSNLFNNFPSGKYKQMN